MPRRTRKSQYRSFSKYDDQAVLMQSKIIRIEYQNKEVKDRFKNVFYVESKVLPEGRMCVHWGKNNCNVGDEIICKGRLNNDGIFLVWSLMILKRNENNEVSSA